MPKPQPFRFPSQQQLLMPLLHALEEHGPMRAKDAAEVVADKMGIPQEARNITVSYDDGRAPTNLFQRTVRWTRQNAVRAGLIAKRKFGIWELADEGHKGLTMAKPGIVICVARDELGEILWAEALSAMGHIEGGSVNAIVTSPPFPLNRQRDYGGWASDRWMDLALRHIAAMKPLLAGDGSMVLNLSDVYIRGIPVLNPYQENLVGQMRRTGWNLCGKFFHINPAKPKATPWVTKSRERIANAVETYYWFSPRPHCKANNRNVLEPYSDRFQRTLAAGGEFRAAECGARQSSPGLRYKVNNFGRIPHNFFVCAHEGPRSAYSRYCASHGLPRHPAIMPRQIAEFCVKFLTDAGDLLYDPFGGSLVLPAACKKFGRRYTSSEKCHEYIRGGLSRLGTDVEDLTDIFSCNDDKVVA
jgi:DNA modification methylase